MKKHFSASSARAWRSIDIIWVCLMEKQIFTIYKIKSTFSASAFSQCTFPAPFGRISQFLFPQNSPLTRFSVSPQFYEPFIFCRRSVWLTARRRYAPSLHQAISGASAALSVKSTGLSYAASSPFSSVLRSALRFFQQHFFSALPSSPCVEASYSGNPSRRAGWKSRYSPAFPA